MNFLREYYIEHREELVRYGYRFAHCRDTAESLFESSHDKICEKRPSIDSLGYLKMMKRAMGNKYKDLLRSQGYILVTEKCRYPEMYSPKPLMALDEKVCRNEELGFIREALGRMSALDQEILLERNEPFTGKAYRKYQAFKRLEKTVNSVMVDHMQHHEKEGNETNEYNGI